jgi:hypothetical protein
VIRSWFAGLKSKLHLGDGDGVSSSSEHYKADGEGPARYSRRGFLAVLGAAAGAAAVVDPERALWRPGARLISVPRPIALERAYQVEFELSSEDLFLSLEQFQQRYISPAAEALVNMIDKDVRRHYRRVRFERLFCPERMGEGRVMVGRMGPLPEARAVVAYDVVKERPGWVGRVDCLVRAGGEDTWQDRRQLTR